MLKTTKESEFNKRKLDIENKEKDIIQKYLLKQEQMDERIKLAKEDKEKENLNKSNKLYISTTNQKIKHLREENAKEYLRSLKFENMAKRTQMLLEKQEKKKEEKEERRRLEDEINKDKQIMMERLQNILHTDEEFTKEEVNDYVFKGIYPKKMKKDEQNKNEENKDVNNEKETEEKNNKEKKEDEDEYNGNNAFITSVPQ